MPASLDQLRTLVAVADAGSVSDAARLLGLSQSTVSTHVQQIEAVLGYPVFDRSPTGMVATARGAELLRRASAPIDQLEDLLDGSAAATTSLQLGGPAEFCSVVLVPRLPALLSAAGRGIRMRFGLADDLLAALRDGELDVVVSAVPPRAPGITAAPLFDEEFVLVAHPSWATRDQDALDGVPVVAYAEQLPIIRRYWRTALDRSAAALTVAAVVPDLRGVLDAVVAGAGMSVLPRYLAAGRLASGEVVELHSPAFAPLNSVFIATRTAEPDRDGSRAALVRAIGEAVAGAGLD